MKISKTWKGYFNGSGLTFPGFDHPIMLYSDDKDSLVANIAKVYMNKFGFNNIWCSRRRSRNLERKRKSNDIWMLIREFIL
jgi:hypothetical protein